MTSNELLTLIYKLSQAIPRRVIETKEILKRLKLEEGFIDEGEIKLLLNNLEKKAYVSLTKSSNAGIVGVSLTTLGKSKVE